MRRYLLVDDNRELAENLAEIIQDSGDEAEVCTSGEQAVACLVPGRYDAVVTDMRMPVMQGAQVVHELRRLDPGLPALVITAYTGEDDLEGARREGLLAVLPKPVPVPALLALLRGARRDALVALVEDDLALRDNLTEALRDRGFGAVAAASVTETDRLGGVRPFLALVDVRVPGGPDGEALRRLVARFPALPVLVVTAHAEKLPEVAHRGIFTKPFDTSALLARVEALYAEARGQAR